MHDGIRGARQEVAIKSIGDSVGKLLAQFGATDAVERPRQYKRDPRIGALFLLEWAAKQLDLCAQLSEGLVSGKLFNDAVDELDAATKRIAELEKQLAKPKSHKKGKAG